MGVGHLKRLSNGNKKLRKTSVAGIKRTKARVSEIKMVWRKGPRSDFVVFKSL